MRASVKQTLLATVGAAALAGASALAGTFTSDFSNPNQTGFTLGSNFATRPDQTTFMPAIENGRLTLTYAEPSENGSIVLDDLDGGSAISAFTATFKLRIGGGSSNPGDGLAFYFGTDVAEGSVFGEEGPESMLDGLSVGFDIFNNGDNEAPAIDVKVNGTLVGRVPMNVFNMLSDSFVDVSIQLKPNGTLSVSHRGTAIFTDLPLPGYAPSGGSRFALGARTGAEYANHWIDDLSITTTLAGAPAAPTISAQPQNVTVNEGSPATFSVGWQGSMPFTFQWLKNDQPIDGATQPTYTIASATGADNGAVFKCTVSNPAGSVTSSGATLTVNVDSVKPTLVSTKGSDTFTKVTVVFSEPVDETTAQNAANYGLTGATVTAAAKTGPATVVLTTTPHAEGATLTLTVNNVRDLAFNPNAIEPNSTIQVKTFVFAPGFTRLEVYDNIAGTAVANLYDDPNYQAGTPSRAMFAAGFDSDTAALGLDVNNENYGAVLYGLVIPPQTASYRFFIRSDDSSELYINASGSDPSGVFGPVAQETGCCNLFLEPGALQTSEPVLLNAGTRYYVRLNLKEGTGDDYGKVAWRVEGDSTPAATLTPIGGTVVGWFADPNGTAINVTAQPANALITENKTATFTVAATGTPGPVWYQWQRAEPGSGTFANIAGARGATYTTPAMKRATDNGAKYRAMIYTPGLSQASAEATLSVEIDSAAPSVVLAVAKPNNKGVTLRFSEAIDGTSASSAAAYTIPGVTVTGARFVAPDVVVLTTTAMTDGASYTVTVSDAVKDLALPPNGVAAPNNTATFAAGVRVNGAAKFEVFANIGAGTVVNDVRAAAKYPLYPDKVTLCNGMESPSPYYYADNYGGKLSGFFVPAATGQYVFYIASDDASELHVSTDDDPDNKVLRATEPGYAGPREWTGNAGGRRPGCDAGDCENISDPISMEAGKAYYVELIYKEGGGGDYGGVRVQLASDEPPAADSYASPLMGATLYTTILAADLDKMTLPVGMKSGLGSGLTDGFRVKTYQAEQLGTTAIADHLSLFEQVMAGLMGPNVANLAGANNGVFNVPGVINFNANTAAEDGFFQSSFEGLYQSADLTVPGIPGIGGFGGDPTRANHNYAQEVISYVEFPAPGVYYFGVNSQNGFRVSAGEQAPADIGALVVHNGTAAGAYYALDSGPDFGGISAAMTSRLEGKLVLAQAGDGSGTAACGALVNAEEIRGNIAVCERGVCTFSTKLTACLDAGAIGVIVVNSRDPGSADGVWPILMGGTFVNVPGVMISKPDGVKIINALRAGEEVHASIAPLLDEGLGYYRRGRSSFETRFAVNVKEAGLYPLRLVWYFMDATDTEYGDCEFFTHTSDDDYVLVNDRTKAGSLKAYSTRDFTPVVPGIGIARVDGTITITYQGVLQSSDTVDGDYTDVTGASSPFTVSATEAAKFYRTRQ